MTTLKMPNLIQQLIHDKAKEHFKIDGDKTVVTMASEDFVTFMTVLTTQSDKYNSQALCDLLEGEKLDEENFEVPAGENIGEYRFCHSLKRRGHNAALTKAQALIRQTLDPISNQE